MQTHSKRDSACFVILLLAATCGAAAQSSTVSAGVDASIPSATNSTGSGQATDSSVSGAPMGSGRTGAGTGLFGAGGQTFNTAIQAPQQKAAGGLITKQVGASSSYGNTLTSSRVSPQAATAAQLTAAPAVYTPPQLPQAIGGGGGEYSNSFPDSARGEAVPNPPFGATTAAFSFSTFTGASFPDMNTEQFLHPELHVAVSSGSQKKKQDLLQKLESRRKNKEAPKDSIFGSKKKSPFAKQSGLSKEQQELKSNSSVDDRKF